MKASLLKRYDINGAWTHDFTIELGEYTPPEDSMWRFYKFIDVDLDADYVEPINETKHFLFSGFDRGKYRKFIIKVGAKDKESAILHFEAFHPELSLRFTTITEVLLKPS